MRIEIAWRPLLLGTLLGAVGSGGSMPDGLSPGWALFPSAQADNAIATVTGGGKVSASAHASANATTSGTAQGCVAESSASAEAEANGQRQSKSDHQRQVGTGGPCRAEASSHAQAGAPPAAPNPGTPDKE
jgi:hypothetical protein